MNFNLDYYIWTPENELIEREKKRKESSTNGTNLDKIHK